jgi:hypothetical protein
MVFPSHVDKMHLLERKKGVNAPSLEQDEGTFQGG